jgi:hypothetical protein
MYSKAKRRNIFALNTGLIKTPIFILCTFRDFQEIGNEMCKLTKVISRRHGLCAIQKKKHSSLAIQYVL